MPALNDAYSPFRMPLPFGMTMDPSAAPIPNMQGSFKSLHCTGVPDQDSGGSCCIAVLNVLDLYHQPQLSRRLSPPVSSPSSARPQGRRRLSQLSSCYTGQNGRHIVRQGGVVVGLEARYEAGLSGGGQGGTGRRVAVQASVRLNSKLGMKNVNTHGWMQGVGRTSQCIGSCWV